METSEFIGSQVEIPDPRNKKKKIQGTIIDETKNTFKIKTATGTKKIIKNKNKFIINGQTIRGDEILKRPEDRIKK